MCVWIWVGSVCVEEGWGLAVGYGVEIILAGHMTLITPGALRWGQQLRAPSMDCSSRAAPLHSAAHVARLFALSCRALMRLCKTVWRHNGHLQ